MKKSLVAAIASEIGLAFSLLLFIYGASINNSANFCLTSGVILTLCVNDRGLGYIGAGFYLFLVSVPLMGASLAFLVRDSFGRAPTGRAEA